MHPSEKTIVKVSSPADILGLLPHRLGFEPRESLVVFFLEGARRRDMLVMRVDLPAAQHEDAVVADVVQRAMHVGASAVVLVCYTEDKTTEAPLVRWKFIDSLNDGLCDAGVEVVDALLVRAGRWWSYLCDSPRCCPPAGSLLAAELPPAAAHYAAESVANGGAVLASREELVRSVRADDGSQARVVRAVAAQRAAAMLVEVLERGGVAAVRSLGLTRLRALVAAWETGVHVLPPDDAATVVLTLRDKAMRDEAMTMLLDVEPEVLLSLLTALARSAGDEDAAPICTVLAWVAHASGDGALANVAIERALDAEPSYEMARLIDAGLEAMLSPERVREVTAQTRRELHPET